MDSAQVVAGGLVIACSDASPLLQLGKEMLDSITQPVQRSVVTSLYALITNRGNHPLFADPQGRGNHALQSVIALVGNQGTPSAVQQLDIGSI